jgi:hypothetical protein
MRFVEKSPTGPIGQETIPLRFPGSIGAEELTIMTNQFQSGSPSHPNAD